MFYAPKEYLKQHRHVEKKKAIGETKMPSKKRVGAGKNVSSFLLFGRTFVFFSPHAHKCRAHQTVQHDIGRGGHMHALTHTRYDNIQKSCDNLTFAPLESPHKNGLQAKFLRYKNCIIQAFLPRPWPPKNNDMAGWKFTEPTHACLYGLFRSRGLISIQ